MKSYISMKKVPIPDSGRLAVFSGGWLSPSDRILDPHESDHSIIVVKGSNGLPVNIGGHFFFISEDVNIDMTDLDTGEPAAGEDYNIFACYSDGSILFLPSLSNTYPSGFNADNSRKIGGAHTLCADVGTISGHDLSGYINKNILPASIWDLRHRPKAEPAGMVYSKKVCIWVDIYLASGTGESTVSAYGGTMSDTRDWLNFVDDFAAVKKKLLSDMDFQIVAAGSNEETNIAGSADPVTTGGHSDTAGRRMISNIGCEDCCGAMWQWLLTPSSRADINIGDDSGDEDTGVTYYNLPGSKGSFGTYGKNAYWNTQLLAGGNWNGGTGCGSRARSASNSRWTANTAVGGRGRSEPV